MRTLHNYLDAAKQRREDGEAGFSLIELIVVVAILGILVAVAIPVFTGIQQSARNGALESAAAAGATVVAAHLADGTDFAADLAASGTADYVLTQSTTDPTIDTFCVVASPPADGSGSLADGDPQGVGANGECDPTP